MEKRASIPPFNDDTCVAIEPQLRPRHSGYDDEATNQQSNINTNSKSRVAFVGRTRMTHSNCIHEEARSATHVSAQSNKQKRQFHQKQQVSTFVTSSHSKHKKQTRSQSHKTLQHIPLTRHNSDPIRNKKQYNNSNNNNNNNRQQNGHQSHDLHIDRKQQQQAKGRERERERNRHLSNINRSPNRAAVSRIGRQAEARSERMKIATTRNGNGNGKGKSKSQSKGKLKLKSRSKSKVKGQQIRKLNRNKTENDLDSHDHLNSNSNSNRNETMAKLDRINDEWVRDTMETMAKVDEKMNKWKEERSNNLSVHEMDNNNNNNNAKIERRKLNNKKKQRNNKVQHEQIGGGSNPNNGNDLAISTNRMAMANTTNEKTRHNNRNNKRNNRNPANNQNTNNNGSQMTQFFMIENSRQDDLNGINGKRQSMSGENSCIYTYGDSFGNNNNNNNNNNSNNSSDRRARPRSRKNSVSTNSSHGMGMKSKTTNNIFGSPRYTRSSSSGSKYSSSYSYGREIFDDENINHVTVSLCDIGIQTEHDEKEGDEIGYKLETEDITKMKQDLTTKIEEMAKKEEILNQEREEFQEKLEQCMYSMCGGQNSLIPLVTGMYFAHFFFCAFWHFFVYLIVCRCCASPIRRSFVRDGNIFIYILAFLFVLLFFAVVAWLNLG